MSKPIITGPGEYRTRGGRQVTVARYEPTPAYPEHVWRMQDGCHTWRSDGCYLDADTEVESDIIGPWTEEPMPPETTPHEQDHQTRVLLEISEMLLPFEDERRQSMILYLAERHGLLEMPTEED